MVAQRNSFVAKRHRKLARHSVPGNVVQQENVLKGRRNQMSFVHLFSVQSAKSVVNNSVRRIKNRRHRP
jgi:hypothetical protein